MHRLVIARYSEPLDWVAEVPAGFEVLITNKGDPVTSRAVLARAAVTDRPNKGREGETYLAHCARDDAATALGFTVFAQGDPFEHSPDFLALLAHTQDWQDIQPLAWRWKVARDIPPTAILQRETADFVDGLRVRPEFFSLSSWAPPGFDDPGTQWLNTTYRALHGLPEGTNIAEHFCRLCGLGALAERAASHRLGRFSYGAVFAVRSAMLAGLPAAARARLMQATCAHSVYGYVLERLWLHLFGAPFALPIGGALPAKPTLLDQAPFHPPQAAPTRLQQVRRLTSRIGRRLARA